MEKWLSAEGGVEEYMVKTMRAEVKKGTVPVADLALGSTFESSSLRHLTTCNIPHLARRVLFRTTMSHHVSFCYTGWETYAQESDRKEWVRNQYCQAVGCHDLRAQSSSLMVLFYGEQ